jgi:hypothetical protein
MSVSDDTALMRAVCAGATGGRQREVYCVSQPLLPVSWLVSARTGGALCTQTVVASSSLLLCNAPVASVGAYPVVVSLNDQNSTSRVIVHRMCGAGRFGLPGQQCGPCPEVRRCALLTSHSDLCTP